MPKAPRRRRRKVYRVAGYKHPHRTRQQRAIEFLEAVYNATMEACGPVNQWLEERDQNPLKMHSPHLTPWTYNQFVPKTGGGSTPDTQFERDAADREWACAAVRTLIAAITRAVMSGRLTITPTSTRTMALDVPRCHDCSHTFKSRAFRCPLVEAHACCALNLGINFDEVATIKTRARHFVILDDAVKAEYQRMAREALLQHTPVCGDIIDAIIGPYI